MDEAGGSGGQSQRNSTAERQTHHMCPFHPQRRSHAATVGCIALDAPGTGDVAAARVAASVVPDDLKLLSQDRLSGDGGELLSQECGLDEDHRLTDALRDDFELGALNGDPRGPHVLPPSWAAIMSHATGASGEADLESSLVMLHGKVWTMVKSQWLN